MWVAPVGGLRTPPCSCDASPCIARAGLAGASDEVAAPSLAGAPREPRRCLPRWVRHTALQTPDVCKQKAWLCQRSRGGIRCILHLQDAHGEGPMLSCGAAVQLLMGPACLLACGSRCLLPLVPKVVGDACSRPVPPFGVNTCGMQGLAVHAACRKRISLHLLCLRHTDYGLLDAPDKPRETPTPAAPWTARQTTRSAWRQTRQRNACVRRSTTATRSVRQS